VQVGRFVSRDTLSYDSRLPSSLHRYVYGLSAPTNNIDPTGLSAISAELTAYSDALIQSPFTFSFSNGSLFKPHQKAQLELALRAARQQAELMRSGAYKFEFTTWIDADRFRSNDKYVHLYTALGWAQVADYLSRVSISHFIPAPVEGTQLAFVRPREESYSLDDSKPIRIRPRFFRLPLWTPSENVKSQMSTIIHEVTHLQLRTQDLIYGARGSRELARNNARVAVLNADNWAFHAKQTFMSSFE